MSITTSTPLKSEFGIFTVNYHKSKLGECVSIVYGDIVKEVPLVRFHSSCLFSEAFHALDCDCRQQLQETLIEMVNNNSGVLIYTYAEGRGVGLEKKIKAYSIQNKKNIDTIEAFKEMGVKADERTYSAEISALKELKANKKIKFASDNPNKINAIEAGGFKIKEIIKFKIVTNEHNIGELLTKKNKLGYFLDYRV